MSIYFPHRVDCTNMAASLKCVPKPNVYLELLYPTGVVGKILTGTQFSGLKGGHTFFDATTSRDPL